MNKLLELTGLGAHDLKIILFSIIYALIYIILGFIMSRLYKKLIKRILKLKTAGKRRATIGNVILSVGKYFIWFLVIILVLEAFGIKTAPILAGAGILGLAIGLGAQRLVADFISGFFILFEESFSIGEVVEIDGFKGEVIDIGLRTTKIKEWRGSLKIINNGDIHTLINHSRYNSVAVVNMTVAYDTDLDSLKKLITNYFIDYKKDNLLSMPKYIGVTSFNSSDIEVRIIAETNPHAYYQIERDIRNDLKILFKDNNIEIPFPQLVITEKTTNK